MLLALGQDECLLLHESEAYWRRGLVLTEFWLDNALLYHAVGLEM